jgi:FixJ family two-component response regulator
MTQTATVYVVDDDPAVRESIRALVTSAGLHVETYSSAESFLQDYQADHPGCLVTDLRMLEMSGLDLLEKLQHSEHPLPTIVISAYADVPVTVRAMQAGAVTLLEKPCRNEQLVQSIQGALQRDAEFRAARSARQAAQAQKEDIQRRLNTLTTEEHEVLRRMVAGKLNKVIANELFISLRTVETRRHKVLEKMKADSLAELVRMVIAVES